MNIIQFLVFVVILNMCCCSPLNSSLAGEKKLGVDEQKEQIRAANRKRLRETRIRIHKHEVKMGKTVTKT